MNNEEFWCRVQKSNRHGILTLGQLLVILATNLDKVNKAAKINKKLLYVNTVVDLWCRWPESNRHGIATARF